MSHEIIIQGKIKATSLNGEKEITIEIKNTWRNDF